MNFRFGILTPSSSDVTFIFSLIGYLATIVMIQNQWEKISRRIRSDEILLWQKQNSELSLKDYQKMSRSAFDKF